ncbi:probable high-affinity nitrate transporter 2.4 isoform X2 [Elaeis guineensis]|uniref:probable high-affinity nitrate transporter 2.4 isoform X2 n=1 Tax=Elaeis guineensis var. tenera TaxID=51953 RepID=UPI003C6D78A2
MKEEVEAGSGFALPVDEESKATELRVFSFAGPHMRAFHLAWLSLFSCFFSTFAAPPLLPVLRATLSLSPSDVSAAGVASVSGAIIARLAMGPACDLVGPRRALVAASLLTATPAIVAAAAVSSPAGFILLRFLSGLSLSNFVANQCWMSSMFSPCVVGLANALCAGWANMGSAAAQLLMPLAYSLLLRLGAAPSTTCRVTLLLPAALQVAAALAVLAFGQDFPVEGKIMSRLDKKDRNSDVWRVLGGGLGNYRGWILGMTYAYSYGVELTMENILAGYFYERFGLGMEAAGVVACCFGAANAVSRPGGGMVSDAMGRRFGMRGRLWSLWAVQTLGGLLGVLLGRVGTLEASMAVMFLLAVFVQAAAGLAFGVVPFVSKRPWPRPRRPHNRFNGRLR